MIKMRESSLDRIIIRPLAGMSLSNWTGLAREAAVIRDQLNLFAKTGFHLVASHRDLKSYQQYRASAAMYSPLASKAGSIAIGARYHDFCATPRTGAKAFARDEIIAVLKLGNMLSVIHDYAHELVKAGRLSVRGLEIIEWAKRIPLPKNLNEDAAFRAVTDGPNFVSIRQEIGKPLRELIGRTSAAFARGPKNQLHT